jgi:hypothetical protein
VNFTLPANDNLSAPCSESDLSNRLLPDWGDGGDSDGPASCGPATSVFDEWVSGVVFIKKEFQQ